MFRRILHRHHHHAINNINMINNNNNNNNMNKHLLLRSGAAFGRHHGTTKTARRSYSVTSILMDSNKQNGDDDDNNKSDENNKSDNNNNNNNKASSSSSSSSSPVSILPSRIGYGDDVPRLPHTIALPLVSRPLFPGLITSVTLTDEATIQALERLMTSNSNTSATSTEAASHQHASTPLPSPYISTFLRRSLTTGVTEGGVHLPTPEVITNEADIYHTGTFAQIQRIQRSHPSDEEEGDEEENASNNNNKSKSPADHSATLILLAHRRVDLVTIDELGPPIQCQVKHWSRLEPTTTTSDQTIRALSNEIISTIREVAQVNALFRESLQFFPMRVQGDNPYKLADFAASISASGTPEDLQAVLEERHVEQRLHKALVLLNKEREVSKLQKEISEKVEEKMTQAQRKYFLTEQLKSIKKELGMERDDKEALVEKYRQQLAEYPAIPEEVQTVLDEELEKFATLEKNSPEYNVTRSYLDWLCGIPWGVTKTENFDLTRARRILDRDHYGLHDVKDVILQFIAIGQLTGTVQGKILCLVGPPGTGKTSIAQSVARALGRDFFRFSVGGLSDVSEIKGHRRTYIGAMPGKLVQCLKSTGSTNPVVLMDEIDKLGMGGYRGDPSSALLEVLDPSQNSAFRDYFLDVPVDISQVLFLCTANELERIPGPLLDRMEVIRLSGYDVPEKICIAEQYLVPKSLKESGLMVEKKEETAEKETEGSEKEEGGEAEKLEEGKEEEAKTNSSESNNDNLLLLDNESSSTSQTPLDKFVHAPNVPNTLQITTEAITSLVRWYAREAGVRNLAKYIDKITRKLALQVVAEREGTELTLKSQRRRRRKRRRRKEGDSKEEAVVEDESGGDLDDADADEGDDDDSWEVNEDNLSDYVGKPVFTSDRLYQEGPLPHGIVMGLAYTSMGGSALYIETQGIQRGLASPTAKDDNNDHSETTTTTQQQRPRSGGGGTLKVTGQLGDVMKESTQIAYTVARNKTHQLDPHNDFFDVTDIHTHVPEGATPKDGPSAGITIVTSMLSLALQKAVRSDVAMTGEVSLTGKVLAVGGIKEKVMAARRAGIATIVLPAACEREFEEIPQYLKDGLTVHYADEYDQVYQVAFEA